MAVSTALPHMGYEDFVILFFKKVKTIFEWDAILVCYLVSLSSLVSRKNFSLALFG
jgi:hypothetical protein